ncbi:MKRN2 opposite strand, tandem duplicate 1 isoform X2 [Channa argus]|uniref:MKRN2 opposite strand, tandem duplicate 1 isoform X2 n=1 Tax=Channa argus TaxID=215402 RepID=UPI003522424D
MQTLCLSSSPPDSGTFEFLMKSNIYFDLKRGRWTTEERSGSFSLQSSEENESELHVGISNSKGVVFSYTELGVLRQQVGWEQSIIVPLVAPGNDRMLWDTQLETFSNLNTWTGDRFQEQREFGSCCYGFALSYINHVMRSEGSEPITREHFTSQYILHRMEAASKYLSVYQDVCQHGYHSTAESYRSWPTY